MNAKERDFFATYEVRDDIDIPGIFLRNVSGGVRLATFNHKGSSRLKTGLAELFAEARRQQLEGCPNAKRKRKR